MPSERERTGMIGKEVMDRLQTLIGKEVTVESVWYGRPQVHTAKLRAVTPFSNIETGQYGIPFVGSGSAIRKISTKEDGTVYENSLIPEDYDVRFDEDRFPLVARSFGEEIARRQKQAALASERRWEEKQAQLNKEMQGKSATLIDEGVKLVKAERVNEWRKYARNNTQDFYSGGVVEATVSAMKALTDGKTPKEAMDTMDGGMTGFQAGCVAQGISYFHARGPEFRKWWNKDNGGTGEEEGTINPALLVMRK